MKLWTSTLTIVMALGVADGARAQAPARPGEPPRSDPARSVTLSLTEYNRLVDLAGRSPQVPAAAPVPALLASADLRVRVDRDTVHGVFALAGEVLRPGVNRVRLIAGATLLDASVDGRPLPLASEGGVHSALLTGPAPFAISLEWGAPLVLAPGRASFVLPVPASGTARATIDVPGEQADVRVSAGLVTRRTAANGRTIVDVTLRPGTPAEVWWSMRDSAPVAAARDVRMLADVLTLVTIGDSDLRMTALVDVSVVQGEPRTIDLRLPDGYDLSAITGASIESSEPRDGGVVLTISDPSIRRIQFLVSLERAHAGGSFSADTAVVSLPGMQRERGEIAIEGVGTLELDAAERTGMHRIDVRELNSALQSLARRPMLSAFRYQRSAATEVGLALNVQRFPDAGVLAAVADRAIATTLVTVEGRALTEVILQVRNRAQPFLKVTLPPGATMVSVEVGGESAKPAVGADGTRVPLLRPGFRPSGVYEVSYVYVHAGTPFARKGEMQMALPRMDMPVGVVQWEMFVPRGYNVEAIDGNVLKRSLWPEPVTVVASPSVAGVAGAAKVAGVEGGVVTGVMGGVVGGLAGGVSGGIGAGYSGADAPVRLASPRPPPPPAAPAPLRENTADAKASEPSQNVINLQRRAAGVLPIRVDVPRAGTSHQFIKPLVVDQEATVSLRYKQRK